MKPIILIWPLGSLKGQNYEKFYREYTCIAFTAENVNKTESLTY